MSTKLKPLTGTGLQLFRVWLYAPAPIALGTLAIQILSVSHLDRVGIWVASPLLIFSGGWILWTRRFERKFGHENLFVQTTLLMVGFMIFMSILYPIMSHFIHMRLHPKSIEYDHWELLLMINVTIPMMLLVTKWPKNWPKRS